MEGVDYYRSEYFGSNIMLNGMANLIERQKQADIDNGCICYESVYDSGLCNPDCPLHKPKPKLKISKERKYSFITIQDFQRRLCDVDKLKQFMDSISYMYEMGEWVIESGKNPKKDEYNLHIHMLVKIRPQVKNHKKVLNIKWMKQFNTSLYDSDYYLLKQHRDSPTMPSYDEWLDEKRSYFVNTEQGKGTHLNTEDLGLRGVWGA